MRTSLVHSATVALLLLAAAGCSTTQPFWNNFAWKKPAAAPSSTITSPPPGSYASSTTKPGAATSPVPSGAQQTSAVTPVYPGTPYPVTPYPQATVAAVGVASSPTYPANAFATSPASAPTGGYMPQNVTSTPGAQPASPYGASPPQGQTYGAAQSQPYGAPPQSGSYNTATTQPGAYTR